jgi:hypothetical protein
MENVHFYFDEAGEKGFLEGAFSDEVFGLVAGIALPTRNVNQINENLRMIFSGLNCDDVEKIHATEIFKDGANQEIKESFFKYLDQAQEWLLVYEAMYPKGYMKSPKPVMPTRENTRYKTSQNKKRERLYNHLLKGLMVRLDEICKNSTNLQMVTDRVDQKLLREALEQLEYLKQEEHKSTKSAFDTQEDKVVYRTITSKITGFGIAVKNIDTIEIEETPSYLTLAADILTNSLYRHLTSKIEEHGPVRLHSGIATDGFVLKSRIAFTDDNYIMDSIYDPTFSG